MKNLTEKKPEIVKYIAVRYEIINTAFWRKASKIFSQIMQNLARSKAVEFYNFEVDEFYYKVAFKYKNTYKCAIIVDEEKEIINIISTAYNAVTNIAQQFVEPVLKNTILEAYANDDEQEHSN